MREEPQSPMPVTDRLHPFVWIALVGLVVWFVLAIWGGFGAEGYADWLLTVISTFIFIVVMIPVILWRVSRNNREADRSRQSFRDWAAGEFQTWQSRDKASDAAIEIVIPIAAAAVGMTAFAIVFHYAAAHASIVHASLPIVHASL